MNTTLCQYAERRQALTIRGQASDRRQPVHLLFVIDISDSMSDQNKLRSVQRSLEHIVPLLTPEDLVSIITFGEESEIGLNKLPASSADAILTRTRQLRTNGCTNMSAGLMNVRPCLAGAPPTHKQGVLLLTDGHANRGVSTPDGLKTIVQTLIRDFPELTLTTVGYGADHNADLLRDMAVDGAGSYNVVYTLEDVATVFGIVLGGLTTVVAQNVTVTLPAGTTLKSGYAQTTDATTGDITVRVGDVYAENEIMLLLELPSGGEVPDGTPRVRVQGHNMLTFGAIDETLTPTPLTPGEAIPKSIELMVFRQQVSQLLKDAAGARYGVSDAIKTRAQDLLRQLQELPYHEEQLVQMMMDDVRDLTQDIELAGATPLGPTVTTQAVNHSHYWATGRGYASAAPALPAGGGAPLYRSATLGTPLPPMPGGPPATPMRRMGAHVAFAAGATDPEENDEVGAMPPPAPAMRQRSSNWDTDASPFLNISQRTTSHTLRASSSAAPPPEPEVSPAPLARSSSAPV